MNRYVAGLLGVLAIIPWAIAIYVAAFWPEFENPTYEQALADHDRFGQVLGVAMACGYSAMAIFIWYAYRGATVPAEKRRLWAALLLFGNLAVLPFFWFWYLWRPTSVARSGT